MVKGWTEVRNAELAANLQESICKMSTYYPHHQWCLELGVSLSMRKAPPAPLLFRAPYIHTKSHCTCQNVCIIADRYHHYHRLRHHHPRLLHLHPNLQPPVRDF